MARPTKNKAGRKPALTQDARDLVVKSLAAGLTFEDAAAAAGVSLRTIMRWMSRSREAKARDRKTPFWQFWQDCRKAALSRKLACRKVVNQAVKDGDLRAAMWELERNWPDEYGPDRIKVAELDRENRRLTDLVRRLEAGGVTSVRPDGPASATGSPGGPPAPGRRKRATAEPAPPAATGE